MAKSSRRAGGEGGVSGPDGAGRWRIQISLGSDLAGKRRRIDRRIRVPNRKAAIAELDRLRAAARMEPPRERAALPSVAAYLAAWLHKKEEKLAEKSVRNYRGLADHIVSVIGRVRLDQLAREHVTELIDGLRERGAGDRTVQACYDTLRAALNYAVKIERVLGSSAILGVPRPGHYYEMKYYTAEEARTFLAAVAEDRLRGLFHLVVGTGLRRGEALGLKWHDFDLIAGSLVVRRALSEKGKMKATKTHRSQRRIALPAFVTREMSEHRERLRAEGLGNCELVFPSRDGRPMDADNMYYRHFLPAIKRSGLRRIRFHDLRHTAATVRLANGDNAKVVQEMLGHAKIETTLGVYGHVIPSMQDNSAALCDRVLAGESAEGN